ncbi:hypothetical protein CDAR_49811 [Caerostris darwini]|uniref:Uncharacterized protein n=1 Tax=Caerostris darwini TaxID=1538125 RepID=A0AAV4T2H5_9ARAC|nr:hypothetical protein CDAR_49811 [Caerostris darwini]
MKSIEHDDTTQRPSYQRNEGLHFRIDKPSRRIVGLPFTLAALIINHFEINTKPNLLLKNVPFITSCIVTPSSDIKQSRSPQKPWSIPGTARPPPLSSQRGSRGDTKGNYRGPPSPIQFPRELPRLLNEKTFPDLGS